MAVYYIGSYDVADQDLYQSYPPKVGPLLAKHGGQILVADSGAKVLEGNPRQVHVVLRFESEEQAMAWYNDPDYAGLKKIRLQATENGATVLARAFSPSGD